MDLRICPRLLLACVIAGCVLGQSHADSLLPIPRIRMYDEPGHVIVEDFNGDGLPDLAAAARFSDELGTGYGRVDVFLTGRDGRFLEVAHYFAGSGTFDVAAGDVNSDGHLDLVAPNNYSSDISVFLGDGQGRFGEEIRSGSGDGDRPASVALGDFNEDGHLDVLLHHYAVGTPGGVQLMFGHGDGSFSPEILLDPGFSGFSVVAADFNEDQHLDFAYASGGVRVRLGRGDGTFAVARTIGSCGSVYSIAPFDLNSDGYVDIAVAHYGSNEVSVLFGQGNGTFEPGQCYLVGLSPRVVRSQDLDHDGSLDLIVAHFWSDTVSILKGLGNGQFAPAIDYYGLTEGNHDLAIADFNLDGHYDLVVLSFLANRLSLVKGSPGGSFRTPERLPSYRTLFVTEGDFNGDGLWDLVSVNHSVAGGAVFLGRGDGEFEPRIEYATEGAIGVAGAVGDLDGDDNEDLAVAQADSNAVSVLLGSGEGALGQPGSYGVGESPRSVVIADVNGDSLPDLVTANELSGDVSVLLGRGASGFSEEIRAGAGPTPVSVVVADFDEDGTLEVAVANRDANQLSVLRGSGDGTFPESMSHPVGEGPEFLAVGDLNDDTHADLVVANGSSRDLTVLLGRGDSTFEAPVNYDAAPFVPNGLTIADIDGDSILDLVVAEYGLSVYRGLGDGTFRPPLRFSDSGAFSVTVADFDRDKQPDVAVGGAGVSIHRNRCRDSMLRIGLGKSTVLWDPICVAESYNVYRGSLSDLLDSEGEGVPDDGYGSCLSGIDPDRTDAALDDDEPPPPGSGFFYLMAYVDVEGIEHGLGRGSSGEPRIPTDRCP